MPRIVLETIFCLCCGLVPAVLNEYRLQKRLKQSDSASVQVAQIEGAAEFRDQLRAELGFLRAEVHRLDSDLGQERLKGRECEEKNRQLQDTVRNQEERIRTLEQGSNEKEERINILEAQVSAGKGT
jgi:predicted RNase H-like nuclease (RuvC/YqgF family)